jgi:NADH-ubiquinone oxidoreductase chain 4
MFSLFSGLIGTAFSVNNIKIKSIALITSIINLVISLIMFILFDFSSKQFQFFFSKQELEFLNLTRFNKFNKKDL